MSDLTPGKLRIESVLAGWPLKVPLCQFPSGLNVPLPIENTTPVCETASGGRRPMDEADVQAIIDQLGGVEALQEGRAEFHEAVLRMNRERGTLMDAAAQAGASLRC